MKSVIRSGVGLMLLLAGIGSGVNASVPDNKQLVTDFYRTMFVEQQVEQAVKDYLAEDYIQHNPYVADGTQPLLDYFVPFYSKNPQATVEIKRVIAEDDLVVVHAHWKRGAEDRGSAVMDLFRVEDGRIVEHWDVVQSVPASSANDNTMF